MRMYCQQKGIKIDTLPLPTAEGLAFQPMATELSLVQAAKIGRVIAASAGVEGGAAVALVPAPCAVTDADSCFRNRSSVRQFS